MKKEIHFKTNEWARILYFMGYDRAVVSGTKGGKVDLMLNIYFGDMPEAIYNTEMYFINTYDDKWIVDEFAKEIIKKN